MEIIRAGRVWRRRAICHCWVLVDIRIGNKLDNNFIVTVHDANVMNNRSQRDTSGLLRYSYHSKEDVHKIVVLGIRRWDSELIRPS